MKIRVMVVEDEPPIQRSICQKIEETNVHFQIAAAVDNGKDAIQYLNEYPVDVLFLDMNLPIVGGKELLEYVSTEKKNVIPVVLSGYTDFEYVKCALANHAMDYLVKPLKSSELKLLLDKIEEKFRKQQFEEKAQKLEDTVNGLEMSVKCEKTQDSYQLYCMLLLTFGSSYGYFGENEWNYAEIYRELELEKKLAEVISHENFWVVDGKSANERLIFIRKGSEPDLNRLNQLFKGLEYKLLTLTVVYYREAVELADIFPIYRQLQKYTRDHMIFLKDSLLVYAPQDLCPAFSDRREEIDRLVLQCGSAGAEKIFETFTRLIRMLTIRPVTHKEAVRDIKYFVSRLCRKHPGHREYFELEDEVQFILENYCTEEEIKKEFSFLIRDTFGALPGDPGDKTMLAAKMKIYLDENFRTNITNQFLAERFGFVPSYLSSIYKAHYGITPIDYVVQKRMDEAKKLLEQGDRKIKYIASQLGYEDSLYFSKVFKKVTGTSPKEFVRLSKEEKA